MVRSTTIFRVHDALPLAASVDDESVSISLTEKALTEYKQQSKLIFRRLNANSEPACSIESGAYTLQCVCFLTVSSYCRISQIPISYLIVDKVIYMCICDNSYPRKLAFSYLDELSKEFQRSYGDKIDGATRPYAFMGFDTFIGKTTRLYRDSRSLTQGGGPAAGPSSRLDQLNENLKDVTQIMTKNMEDLLWRGDSLDRMSQLSTSLRSESAKYRKAARNINLEALIRKWAPIGGIGLFFILFIWWRFF
ncbi:vesicle transporter SEC22 [Cryptococcus bacillisporus CA1873]|uniref:Protein transport protein SEC22 n=2 Tax=Cryptococcus gattii TaxID=552467 RepID=A0A0D0VWQ4_CRYGA|nr:vesicle transporter SEC22 [Cryptococcus bacillisporus CA1280]KIR68562.1 vesicle transporter SEC22 [Cryptococcus bacillisporus CA1873]|eukprot:KIR68562.1 vesicle transporter SEC22 [Cryptococcus gattii CA1873]